MKNFVRFLLIMAIPFAIVSLLSISGCKGSAGKDGADGTNASACLRPCHNQPDGIWSQYRESTHFREIFLTDETDAFTAGTCGKCHAKDGLQARLDGLPNSPTNTDLGHFSYLVGSTVTETSYDGETTTAQITCVTCHAVLPDTNAFNQHNPASGMYTEGHFPRRIQTAVGMYIEKSSGPGLGTGTQIDNFHEGNTCAACHKSRGDVADKIKNTPTGGDTVSLGTSRRFGPHEGPGTDLYSGKGGYHFGSNTYGNSAHLTGSAFTGATGQGCVACHMGDRTDNYGYPTHDFKPIVTATCTAACHTGATDIASIGTTSKTAVVSALAQLQGILNSYVPVMSTGGTPTAGLLSQTDNSLSVIDSIYSQSDPKLSSSLLAANIFDLDAVRVQRVPTFNSTTGAWTFKTINIKLTKDQSGAVWNYFMIARAKGYGAHNYKYTMQLLFDSITAFGGTPGFTRPA
jgi:hypothetical protein